MYGLIKSSKPDWSGKIGSFTALAVAFASVSAALYVIATAFTGGSVA